VFLTKEPFSEDRKMKRIGMVLLLAVCVVSSIIAQEIIIDPDVPPGAAALGYTKCVINESPTAADIAPGDKGNYKWFSGQWWYSPPPSLDHYSTQDDVLALGLGGDLVSAPKDFSTGKLPLLPGSDGFYVEFDYWLSNVDPDHFPAVWLMPAEHNRQKSDVYSGDPPKFERWMKLDVDEGNFGPGLMGSVVYTWGIYPNWERILNDYNHISPLPLDRSQKHTFGASYDPIHKIVTWWVNGVKQMSAGAPHVPAIAAKQHFYLILSTQSHGKQKPYSMFISGVRAYVPQTGLKNSTGASIPFDPLVKPIPVRIVDAREADAKTTIDELYAWEFNGPFLYDFTGRERPADGGEAGAIDDVALGHVRAATYVVDQAAPGAADTNPGTEEKPFKTVQHAADAAKPGDTVYVMAGKYDERVKVKAGGTEGKPVAFVAMPRRSATVGGFDLEASYIRVEGFEITADKPATAVQLRASHCEILDNYIHDMMAAVNGVVGKPSADGNTRDYSAVTHSRIAYNKVYHSEYGFILGGEDWLVENNEVSRLFMYAPGNRNDDCDYSRFFGKGCIQRYNYYHGTLTSEIKVAHVDCIQTFMNNGGMAQDLLFEFNTCFDWGQGAMVESTPYIGNVRNWTFRHNIYSSKLPTYKGAWGLDVIQTPDVTIENNTFAGITWCGVGLRGKESTNGQIRNNLFYDMQQAVLDGNKDDFTPANPVIEYNLTFKTAPLANGTNINGKDPLFEDPQKRDFRLKKGSPAIGAGKGGVTTGALEYPNVYYVDPRHPAAVDEPAWGYPAVPLASLAKACAIAQPGETIVLRGGVYREVLAPKNDGVTVRAMKGEKVTISGADLIEGWKREVDSSWSATLAAEPKKLLRDGQPWSEFSYDKAAKRIMVRSGGDPRLHVFETVLREQGIDMVGKNDAKIEEITVVDTLKAGAANP
jgi:hypothetical protein